MFIREIVFVMTSLLAWGCAAVSYDKAAQSWDAWVGTSKDDRVMELGIPNRCHTFKSGVEACEWPYEWTTSSSGTITILFDPKGNVCQWTYRDFYEIRKSQSQCS